MPQMMPLLWLLIFIFLMIIMLNIIFIIYSNFFINLTFYKLLKNSWNWKW